MRRLSFKTQFKIEFLGPFYGPKKSLKKALNSSRSELNIASLPKFANVEKKFLMERLDNAMEILNMRC